MSLIKQRRITDYFEYHRHAVPGSSIAKSDKGKAVATLRNLPNELLLCIFDQLRWELREFDAARRLYGVCKRFYNVFAPKAFQNIVCHGTRVINRLKLSLEEGDGVPAYRVKHAHFRYLTLNQITFMAVRDQLVPSIVLLPNLTSLTLENIVVNVELVRAIGQLPNLAFLTYDVVYPNSHLALNPLFGTFSTDQFNNDPCLPPSSLQSLSVRFMCEDGEYLAFDILKSILYASRNTLQVINIDFNQCCGWMPLHKIISEYYPSLRRFCVYHACFAWASFAPFYSAHSKTLQHVSVFFHSDPDVEEPTIDQSPRRESLVLLRDIPGLSSFTTPEHKTAPWRIESFTIKLGIDPSDNITAREMTLMRGRWEMLPYIAMEHPYIQVLNMWDGALFSGNTIVETLRVASPGLTKVEVLRFNCGRRGLDGLCKVDLRPLGILCDSDQPNTWCRCASCEAGIYTEEGRNCLREEWEDVVWQSYQDQIRRILPFMPRLKLVEWFVGWRVSTLHEVPIPFWEWNIDRLENGRPHLKRRLRNWPCNNPFVEKVPWSAARGMGSTV